MTEPVEAAPEPVTTPAPDPSNTAIEELVEPLDEDDDVHDRLGVVRPRPPAK
jgi:hypothetical protein